MRHAESHILQLKMYPTTSKLMTEKRILKKKTKEKKSCAWVTAAGKNKDFGVFLGPFWGHF